jgi:hypothetical protein
MLPECFKSYALCECLSFDGWRCLSCGEISILTSEESIEYEQRADRQSMQVGRLPSST